MLLPLLVEDTFHRLPPMDASNHGQYQTMTIPTLIHTLDKV